jgi:hypothetical protein
VESLLPFIIIAIVLVLAVIVFSRRKRDAADVGGSVRLGPSWSPPEDDLVDDPSAMALRDRDLAAAGAAVDLDERAVATTLEAWWEYLSVLRVRPLPRAHRYRFYDPYDPPVTELGPDGPVPDPVRVARDVAQRTSVQEIDAMAVLHAVVRDGAPVASGRPGEGARAVGEDRMVDDGADGDPGVGNDRPIEEEVAPVRDEPEVRDGRSPELDGVYDDVIEDPDDVIDEPDDGPRH